MLRPYQIDAANFLTGKPRCFLSMPMGMGKSLTTLTALDHLAMVESIYPILVIAPLRVAQSTWPGEIQKWAHLHHLTVSPIIGTPKVRMAAVERKADIYTINYEGIPWLIDYFKSQWPFKVIVADESTKLKGFRTRQGSIRAQILSKVAFKSNRFIGLTGTICPNGLQDLWGQFWFADKGHRLGTTFAAFQQRWFRSVQVGDNAFATKLVPFEHSQKEIEDRIRDITFALDARDHFDIAEPIVNKVMVALPPKAKALYQRMQEEMLLELESGTEVEAFNAASKTMKCLQVASGFVYTDDKRNWEEIHTAKLDALESVVEEAGGMPVLVAYSFKADLERLLKRFPKGKAIGKDPKTIDQWNSGNIPVMFVHPKSAGHGLNLQSGSNILCFYGLDWNLEERLQVIERIGPVRQAQAGFDRPVFIHYLIAENTLDATVLARVDEKKSILDCLMEALKK